jgi:hypothetical protein
VRQAYVHEAELALEEGVDPRQPGAIVTNALCGSWDHEGPCRWPNNHDIELERVPAVFRTIFVSEVAEAAEIRARIEEALATSDGWTVESIGSRELREDEQELAAKLVATPTRAT